MRRTRIIMYIAMGWALAFQPSCAPMDIESAGPQATSLEATVNRRKLCDEKSSRTYTDARVGSTNNSGWKLARIVDTKIRPAFSFFLNDEVWFIGGQGALYLSKNRGIRWERIRLPLSEDYPIRFVRFRDRRTGWVVAEKNAAEQRFPSGQELAVLHTIDGGDSWKEVLRLADISGTDLLIGESSVWLSGIYYGENTRGVLINITEEGSFGDYSGALEEVAGAQRGVMGLTPVANGDIYSVTADGSILRLRPTNGRLSLMDSLELNRNTVTSIFAGDGSTIWTLSASSGIEGTGSKLSSLVNNENTCSIRSYGLPGYFLVAGTSIGETGVLVIGNRIVSGSNLVQTEGVILYSNDGGHQWDTVNVPGRKDMVRLQRSDRGFIVLSENGRLVHLVEKGESNGKERE